MAALSQLFLVGLGAVVSLQEDWAKRHRRGVLLAFAILGIVGLVATVKQAGESAKANTKLSDSLTSLGNSASEISRMATLNTQLQRRLLDQSDTIAGLAEQAANSATGGDSYVMVTPIFTPLAANQNTFSLAATVCRKCKYSIPNAHIFLQADAKSQSIGTPIYEGTIDPNFFITLPQSITAATTRETTYTVTVLARNKPTIEILKIRANVQAQQWQYSYRIERQVRSPHFNPKTRMAEGEVLKVLEDVPWMSNGMTPSNPATTTILK